MFQLHLASLKAFARLSTVLLSLFDLAEFHLVVLVHHVLILDIGDLRQAVIWQLGWSLFFAWLRFGWWVDFGLFSSDEIHEFIDGLKWVVLHLIVLLAAGAVYVLVLLAHQVLDDSLDLGRKVSLSTIPVEGFDMLSKLFHVNLFFQG